MDYGKQEERSVDTNGMPIMEGTYLVIFPGEKNIRQIDVYRDRIRGLCCFRDDIDNDYRNPDCHVPVKETGLGFIKRIGNIKDKINGISKTQNA